MTKATADHGRWKALRLSRQRVVDGRPQSAYRRSVAHIMLLQGSGSAWSWSCGSAARVHFDLRRHVAPRWKALLATGMVTTCRCKGAAQHHRGVVGAAVQDALPVSAAFASVCAWLRGRGHKWFCMRQRGGMRAERFVRQEQCVAAVMRTTARRWDVMRAHATPTVGWMQRSHARRDSVSSGRNTRRAVTASEAEDVQWQVETCAWVALLPVCACMLPHVRR